tara:strand:+ start:8499 stop:8771 length:273 start_codon:yes stop_codon:yes gene_type:complete
MDKELDDFEKNFAWFITKKDAHGLKEHLSRYSFMCVSAAELKNTVERVASRLRSKGEITAQDYNSIYIFGIGEFFWKGLAEEMDRKRCTN